MEDPLIRRTLAPGTIDLTFGEAHVIARALRLAHPPRLFELGDLTDCTYQPPAGWAPLVGLLERRTGQRAVVTCGAKQALCAVFYALKKRGFAGVTMRTPYWSQLWSVIHASRLRPVFIARPLQRYAHLVVSPNNPDGHVTSRSQFAELRDRCDALNVPLVHDAAYDHEVYRGLEEGWLDGGRPHVSIYSGSKATGMSGLRIGYMTVDPRFDWLYDSALEYVEMTSVGVSLPAQWFLHELLVAEEGQDGEKTSDHRVFTSLGHHELVAAREELTKVDVDVLEASHVTATPGMFAWCRTGPRFDAAAARVAVAPGKAFGSAEHVRLNLAVGATVIREAVERLNAVGR